MSKKVKVVGYAQRQFFDGGIEYRNFTDDLVGQQVTSDGGTVLFTNNNFNITTNTDPKLDKTYLTNPFSKFMCLEQMDLTCADAEVLIQNNLKLYLNLDSTSIDNFAYFGNARELVRVALEQIILFWPAALYVDPITGITTGNTIENYSYDVIENKSEFRVPTSQIRNQYNINYNFGGSLTLNALTANTSVQSNEDINPLRTLESTFLKYNISATSGEFKVIGFTGSTPSVNEYLNFEIKGNPFPNSTATTIGDDIFYVKPNEIEVEAFFKGLPDFEKHLLNRQSIPKYKARFSYPLETDSGKIIQTERDLIWTTSDGYNLDFDSTQYVVYVSKLLNIADSSDETKSDLINRFFTAEAIHDFDSVRKYSTIEEEAAGQKANKLLKIYGREYDEIKRWVDGISLAHTVSYNKRDNTPDGILKNLSRVMGWDVISSIEDNQILNSLLSPSASTFSGQSVGLTAAEAEIELWRRLILNTPWLWKSKGSRKAIEFLFKFIGAPTDLVRFNEYVYVADAPMNMELFNELLRQFNDGDTSLDDIVIDSDGYPKPLPDTPEMYFQNDGLWYRETGGQNSIIDILEGNNPHMGPYDGGSKYINQFRECLISNFSATTVTNEIITTGITNLFSNYNSGTMNGLAHEDVEIYTEVLGSNTNTNFDDCFEVTSDIIDDPQPEDDKNECGCTDVAIDDDILILNIKKRPVTLEVVDCNYSSYDEQDDGFVVFTIEGKLDRSIHPECCRQLGYEPILVDGSYWCKWETQTSGGEGTSFGGTATIGGKDTPNDGTATIGDK